jgi:hypothetical protein
LSNFIGVGVNGSNDGAGDGRLTAIGHLSGDGGAKILGGEQ